jgi:RND superfamily putative drug exporter
MARLTGAGHLAIVAAWAVAVVALAPGAAHIERRLAQGARIAGSESDAVETALERDFAMPLAHYAVGVVTGLPDSALGPALPMLARGLAGTPGVTGAAPYPGAGRAGAPRLGIILAGLSATGPEADSLVLGLRAASAREAAALRSRYPEAAIRWTGTAPINLDTRRASADDIRRAETRALPLTLLLLLWTFGAVVAATLPVLLGVVATVLALGSAAILTQWWTPAILLQNVGTLLGLALGIDYALLTVSRFRETLAAGATVAEAVAATRRHAGRTIALSGVAVAVGFTGLLVAPATELRSAAVGGLLVVVGAVLAATTLLPSLLALLGRRVDAGRLGAARAGAMGREAWRRWGRWVVRRPWRVLVVASLPLLLLAWQVRRLTIALPATEFLPRSMESAAALRDLERAGLAAPVYELRLLVRMRDGGSVLAGNGWNAVRAVGASVGRDPRVARVLALPTMVGELLPSEVAAALVPDSVRHRFTSKDGRIALLEVQPADTVAQAALAQLARDLRGREGAGVAAAAGAAIQVGGAPAYFVDYQDAVIGRFGLVALLVVAATGIALGLGFRSVLVPLKAIALNLLTVAASVGALVLAFQDGLGGRLLGVPAPLGGILPVIPVLAFCALFGIGIDYEVFLVARVAEARRGGRDESEAIAAGLAETGGLITSAAAVMIVVFGAFAAGAFLPTRMIGFTLAVAVLLDATLVRMALGPALLQLAGRWNWWPGDRRPAARPP